MFQSNADRNLLFGLLALQRNLLTRKQLIAVLQAWTLDKDRPIGDVLLIRKIITADNLQMLEALVQKHLALHDNDTQKSLSAVSSLGDVKTELLSITDPDVQTSVEHLLMDDATLEKPIAPSSLPGA